MPSSIPRILQWIARCISCLHSRSLRSRQPKQFPLAGAAILLLASCTTSPAQLVQVGRISTVAGTLAHPGHTADGGPASSAMHLADADNSVVSEISPSTFAQTNVGSSSTPQNLFFKTTAAETITSFTVALSQGNKQEYTVGKVTGCAVDGVTSNPAGTICTVPITFSPAYPGLRSVPLQVATSAGKINIGLNGIGVAPLAVLTPGTMSTLAGEVNPPNCNAYNGPALQGPLCNPSAGAIDAAGNVYVASFYSNTISKVDTSGNVTVVAGTGGYGVSGIGGPATSANIERPSDVVIDAAGNVYFSDETAQQVFKVDAITQIITSIAGNGTQGYSGDNGPATMASFNRPEGVALDTEGNLYVEDQDNNLIRKVDTAGVITTVAGNPATIGQGATTFSGDGGPATQANLELCCSGVYAAYDSIAVDSAGNLFIGDSGHQVVREVTTDGIIHTVAGNNALGAGYSGDGGAATSAQLNWPMGVGVDPAGDLYIADFSNNRIRKVDAATQTITTVAGNGLGGSAGDGGPATQVSLSGPQKVVLDGEGNLYVADTKNNLVRKTDVSNPTLTFITPTAVGSTDTTDGAQGAMFSNIGNAPLILPTPSNGTNPSISTDFSLYGDGNDQCVQLIPSPDVVLDQGSSCLLTVNFRPTVAGDISGSLVLTDNSLNATSPYATQTITLKGTGTGAASAPQPVLTPATLGFGSLTVGSTSAAQTATLKNTGNAPLTISSFGFFGSNASSFGETNNCGASLAAGASCSIAVTCTPAATGSLSASLGANFPSPIVQQSISLTCTGTAAATPQAALSPAALSFTTIAGTTPATQVTTLTNKGNAALTITSIAIGGTNATAFTETNTCGTSLAAGSSCTVTVSFTATSAGNYSATLTATDNASSATQTVQLTGVVTAASAGAPAATLTPSTLNFGSIETGTTSAAQNATLTNTGDAPLVIAGITLAGTNSAVFTSTNTCGNTLAAGASCTISVTFNPTSAGTDAATLSVSDNAPGSPQTSSLTGVATAPPPAADFSITATPASQSVTSGSSATYQINLASSNGSFAQQVALSASGLPTGATVTFSPASVTPGGAGSSSTMTIQTLAQQASVKNDRARMSVPAGLISVALLMLPFRRTRRILQALGCLLLLLGISGALTACGGGFALPQTNTAAATYTVTVTGTSGSLQHSTSVQITVR